MKLPKPSGCLFPGGRGNDKKPTTLVEVQGIGLWTRVQLPSGPYLVMPPKEGLPTQTPIRTGSDLDAFAPLLREKWLLLSFTSWKA